MGFAKLSESLPKKVGRVADVMNEPDFTALATAVLTWRLRHGLSQATVAARGGPSDTTLSAIEAEEWNSTRPDGTLAKLDAGLWWPPGTARKILFEGFNPVAEVMRFEKPEPRTDLLWNADVDLPDTVEALEDLMNELQHEVLVREATVFEEQAKLNRARATLGRVRTHLHRLQDLGQAREGSLLERREPVSIFDPDPEDEAPNANTKRAVDQYNAEVDAHNQKAARRTPTGEPTPGQQRREATAAAGEENQDQGETS